MRTLHLKTKWIDFLYRVATGSKKFRNLLTPIGAIFFILFTMLFVIVALQLDKVLSYSEFITEPLNIILALPLIILGTFISGWSVLHFLKVKGTPVPINPPPVLVASGPFAYVRNPMVTGIFIILFGLSILYGSVTLILLFTPLFIFINIWELKAIEEPELEKRLGEEYIEYKKRTPMFIPSFRKRTRSISNILVVIVITILSKNISAQVNFTAPELIGRVSDSSITINVETDDNLDYYFEYGLETGVYIERIPESGSLTSIANEPFEIIIDGLSSNSRYYYRLIYSSDNGNSWLERDEHSFHTQRSVESNFIFTITSDSHQSTQTNSPSRKLYQQTLVNVHSDNPDLHFDLGDAFAMPNVDIGDTNATREQYLSQRSSMDLISHSTPLFLVIGNHEDEEGWNLDDAGSDLASSKPIMSTNARKRYFLNPIPDDFYSGNRNNSQLEIDDDHLRENYFAFEWGDALFVGIDPYWNTLTKPYSGTAGGEVNDEVIGDRWDWTLGEVQYLWFKQTLESSNAKWKFVFSHQVVGGTSDYGRGGAEATNDYEWGANQNEFGVYRPDCPVIHLAPKELAFNGEHMYNRMFICSPL